MGGGGKRVGRREGRDRGDAQERRVSEQEVEMREGKVRVRRSGIEAKGKEERMQQG